jgi:hypothetical protein
MDRGRTAIPPQQIHFRQLLPEKRGSDNNTFQSPDRINGWAMAITDWVNSVKTASRLITIVFKFIFLFVFMVSIQR